MTVAPPMGDRIEAVGDRNDSGRERDSLALQATRIAGPIPALVVGGDSLAQIRVERGERSKNLGPALRVGSHGPPLLWCELGLVVKDVGESLVELTDIVEQRDALDAAAHALIEFRGFGQQERISRDATHVAPVTVSLASMALSRVSMVAAPNRSALVRIACS